jgi:glycosyltransferase involved in cell wall biosynthesis
MKYSVVVPFYNEERNVAELYVQAKTVMETVSDDFEFVFVDDGSTDRTFAILSEIAGLDERVTVVQLRRNYGKTEAQVAGFDHADGDCIVAMYGDLQHNPHDLPHFLRRLEEGYEVVCGYRLWPAGALAKAKQIPLRTMNWLLAKASGVELHDFAAGFKAFRNDVIRQLPLYGELQRFIPASALASGARVCEVPICVPASAINQPMPGIFDLLTIPFLLRSVAFPAHFFGRLSLAAFFIALVTAAALLAAWLGMGSYHALQHGILLIFGVAILIGSLQLMCMGLIGGMMVSHYQQGAQVRRKSAVLRIMRRG